MLERILLAAIATFCIYLFLNVGAKSSKSPNLDAQRRAIPGFITQAPFFTW